MSGKDLERFYCNVLIFKWRCHLLTYHLHFPLMTESDQHESTREPLSPIIRRVNVKFWNIFPGVWPQQPMIRRVKCWKFVIITAVTKIFTTTDFHSRHRWFQFNSISTKWLIWKMIIFIKKGYFDTIKYIQENHKLELTLKVFNFLKGKQCFMFHG